MTHPELGDRFRGRAHPPAFNLPTVLWGLIGLLAAVHLLRASGLFDDDLVLGLFAFFPARLGSDAVLFPDSPLLEEASRYWSLLTYSLLHADWLHLVVNCTWMMAFGSIVARRLEALRFVILSALGAIAGAVAYLVAHPVEFAVLVGASAAISAQVAAAARLMFVQPFMLQWMSAYDLRRIPPLSLVETFTNRRALSFILLWLVLNVLFGLTGIGTSGEGRIAWEAHLGGFISGLLLLGLLDRRADA
jgi:membrane associated rhomboid family serine protease